MFDLFRSRAKAVRYLLGGLLILVALSMVVTLIPGYGSAGRGDDTVIAEIGKEAVTVRDVQKIIQDAIRRKEIPSEMAQIYAPQVVEQIISERALAYQANRIGLNVSDEELATTIRGLLTRFTGGAPIDKAVYERIVNDQGFTIPEFESNMRKQILLNRIQNIAAEGVVVTPKEIEDEYNRRNTKAKIDYIVLKPEDLRSQIQITAEEVQNYYNANKQTFRDPERKDVVVLIADQAKVEQALQISDAELRAAYDRNRDQYRTPERVKVRHILLKTTDKTPAEVDKIKAKAQDVLKQLKAGANFAELAKKYSDDPGSAVKGGDLDWVVRGQTVKNFENAAFTLKPNQLSDLVTTEYGFHIIQVLDKQDAHLRSFEEVKPELEASMKKGLVVDRMQTSTDQARAALQKNPGQYDQIAAEYHLEVVKADKVAPGAPIAGVGQSPDLDTALASMRKGDVSPVVQVSPTRLAVAEVTGVTPARILDLPEVDARIRTTLTTMKVASLANDKAAQAAKRLNAGESIEAVAKSLGAPVKSAPEFTSDGAIEGLGSAQYFGDVFTKPVGTVVGPVNVAGQIVVAKSTAKTPPDMSQLASQREAILMQLKQKKAIERRELFADSVLTRLIREGKVKRHQATIQRLVASYRG